MSSTRTAPCLPAWPSAASDAARTVGVDRCVPVISSARQWAMKSSWIAAASIAMSAQFSRTNSSGKVSRSFRPSSTRPVRRSGSTCTMLVSQPSRCRVSTRKRPICSSPTREIIAARRPSRAAPKAMLAELPPRYLAKLATSSRREPTCWAYRSTARRPRQARSKRRGPGNRRLLTHAPGKRPTIYFTEPIVKPCTMKRWPKTISTSAGMVARMDAAAIWPCWIS